MNSGILRLMDMEQEAIMRFQIDPEISELLFPLTVEEYQELERSLLEEGCR